MINLKVNTLINKRLNILVLGKGTTKFINSTEIQAEQMYPTNFSTTSKKFVLSLHYNKRYSCLFINSTEQIKFKAADSGISSDPTCLGCISYNDTHDHKSGLDGYVYDIVQMSNSKYFPPYSNQILKILRLI